MASTSRKDKVTFFPINTMLQAASGTSSTRRRKTQHSLPLNLMHKQAHSRQTNHHTRNPNNFFFLNLFLFPLPSRCHNLKILLSRQFRTSTPPIHIKRDQGTSLVDHNHMFSNNLCCDKQHNCNLLNDL